MLLDGLQIARQLGEDSAVVYHLMELGRSAQEMGEAEAAYAWLQDALHALTPSTDGCAYFRYCINLSLSHLSRDRDDRVETLRYAEIALGEARKSGNPEWVTVAQRHPARIQRWRGEQAEALPLVEEALATSRRLHSDFRVSYSLALKIELLTDLGLTEQAQATYTDLWAMDIQNPDRYLTIGSVAYKTMRDLTGAETTCRRFLEGRPTHPDGHCKLALVLYDQGRAAEAVRSWRDALTHRNEFPEALAGLALGLWTLGERDEALTIFGQAVGLQPRVIDPDYLDEKFEWSRQAVEAVRPLIAVSAASQSIRASNDADSTSE